MTKPKKRMDAIERRLAFLEEHALAMHEDPPEFSCTPDEGTPMDEVVLDLSAEEYGDPSGISQRMRDALTPTVEDAVAEGLATGRSGRYTVEDRGVYMPDDVRERVSDRATLADAFASREYETQAATYLAERDAARIERERWRTEVERLTNSLLGLQEMSTREALCNADVWTLIESCLAQGATITPEGLKRDE